ncbi:hypothetical protein [Yoonia sp.]|uniref:hypothetical protein n=1 Tax=Yoonia sp. TaxID=2212373 RepID=UPI00358F9220
MKATKRMIIKDTAKSKNITVDAGNSMTLDEMEDLPMALGNELGLVTSKITILGSSKYPGNRHWHFKQDLKSTGYLDATYWPKGPLFWITIRNYEPDWIHKAGRDLALSLKKRVASVR